MEKMRTPIILLVEDDSSYCQYFEKKFLEDTKLGLLIADDLGVAQTYLDQKDIPIDAIVSDIIIEGKKSEMANDMVDGFSILAYAKKKRPKTIQYIHSFWCENQGYKHRATKLKLNIAKWIPKVGHRASENPWHDIERDVIRQKILADAGLRRAVSAHGLDLTDSKAEAGAAELVREVIELDYRRAFIQSLPTKEFKLIKPIEVLCEEDDSDGKIFSVSAWRIGLITRGVGYTLKEAIDNLASIIAGELEIYYRKKNKNQYQGYAKIVRDRLFDHVELINKDK